MGWRKRIASPGWRSLQTSGRSAARPTSSGMLTTWAPWEVFDVASVLLAISIADNLQRENPWRVGVEAFIRTVAIGCQWARSILQGYFVGGRLLSLQCPRPHYPSTQRVFCRRLMIYPSSAPTNLAPPRQYSGN